MSNNQIVNLDFLDREAMLYKQSKDTLKTTSETIDKAIIDNTKKEVEDVQNAIKILNNKVEKIMETDYIKDKQNVLEASKNQMHESIKKASEAFFKVKKYIQEKDGLSEEQKQQYTKKLYDKIIDKFMTQEEKKLFEQLISNNIIIMNSNGMRLGGGGRGMSQLRF